MSAAQNKSEQAQGRIIHLKLDVTLRPPNYAVPLDGVGSTDAAMDIGRGLVSEAIGLLRMSAEREGFTVEIKTDLIVVY